MTARSQSARGSKPKTFGRRQRWWCVLEGHFTNSFPTLPFCPSVPSAPRIWIWRPYPALRRLLRVVHGPTRRPKYHIAAAFLDMSLRISLRLAGHIAHG